MVWRLGGIGDMQKVAGIMDIVLVEKMAEVARFLPARFTIRNFGKTIQ
jgi:hypothetical protein